MNRADEAFKNGRGSNQRLVYCNRVCRKTCVLIGTQAIDEISLF